MRKRMKTVRGLWAGLLAAAVVLTSAAPSALTVQAEEADAVQTAEVSGVEYQIYPTPHDMKLLIIQKKQQTLTKMHVT